MDHGRIDQDTAKAIAVLRERIEKSNIPSSKLDENINLATWNVREFGRKRRSTKAVHLIAEIMNQFDLIAVTEVRSNVTDLHRVMEILGPYWKVVYSDFIQDAGGNRERIAYLYDYRAVAFTGLAAEADAPRKKDPKTKEYVPLFSWWRSPFIASFSAGSFDFVLITAHIRWGSSEAERIKPLQLLADWIDKRRRDRDAIDQDIIVMGDFNIPSTRADDKLFQAISSKGLRMPPSLAGVHGTNLAANKRYDQILYYQSHTKSVTRFGGSLDYYAGNHQALFPGMSKTDFTFQMSDHLPLWVMIDVDTEAEQLDQVLNR